MLVGPLFFRLVKNQSSMICSGFIPRVSRYFRLGVVLSIVDIINSPGN